VKPRSNFIDSLARPHPHLDAHGGPEEYRDAADPQRAVYQALVTCRAQYLNVRDVRFYNELDVDHVFQRRRQLPRDPRGVPRWWASSPRSQHPSVNIRRGAAGSKADINFDTLRVIREFPIDRDGGLPPTPGASASLPARWCRPLRGFFGPGQRSGPAMHRFLEFLLRPTSCCLPVALASACGCGQFVIRGGSGAWIEHHLKTRASTPPRRTARRSTIRRCRARPMACSAWRGTEHFSSCCDGRGGRDTTSHTELTWTFPALRYSVSPDNLLVDPLQVWIEPFAFDDNSYVDVLRARDLRAPRWTWRSLSMDGRRMPPPTSGSTWRSKAWPSSIPGPAARASAACAWA
jgi:hypothetical protein